MLADTYVTDTAGTGIVQQAPAFGEDDHRIALAHGVVREDEIPPCPLDEAGRFTAEVPDYQGMNVKVCRSYRCSASTPASESTRLILPA